MVNVFLTVLDMSIKSCWVILAVLAIRLLLKQAPKKYSYLLWGVVGFRLCCPVSFKSFFSLFSLGSVVDKPDPIIDTPVMPDEWVNYVPQTPVGDGEMQIPQDWQTPPDVQIPTYQSGATVENVMPHVDPVSSISPMELFSRVATVLWILGIAALVICAIVSYVKLRRNLWGAIRLRDNVWQSDYVRSPFILGFIRPKIYVPFGIAEAPLSYALAHERYHIKRLDHLVKPISFLILAVHWFNPIVWVAFILMGKDMEMSCDEKVLSRNENIKKEYSLSLLSFAANRRFPAPSPLAFGETGVKSRIKNVLKWKRPKLWMTVIALLLCVVVIVACAADPKEKTDGTGEQQDEPSITDPDETLPGIITPDETHPDVTEPDETAPGEELVKRTEWNTVEHAKDYYRSECLYMNPFGAYSEGRGESQFTFCIVKEDEALKLEGSWKNNSNYEGGDVFAVLTHNGRFERWWSIYSEDNWQPFPYTIDEWKSQFILGVPDILPSDLNKVEYYYVNEVWYFLRVDGEIWAVETHEDTNLGRYVWTVYTLSEDENDAMIGTSNNEIHLIHDPAEPIFIIDGVKATDGIYGLRSVVCFTYNGIPYVACVGEGVYTYRSDGRNLNYGSNVILHTECIRNWHRWGLTFAEDVDLEFDGDGYFSLNLAPVATEKPIRYQGHYTNSSVLKTYVYTKNAGDYYAEIRRIESCIHRLAEHWEVYGSENLAEHELYLELLENKEATLEYIFMEFLAGVPYYKEGGVMNDILFLMLPDEYVGFNDAAVNGQDYFNMWREYVEEKRSQRGGVTWMQENMPGALKMLTLAEKMAESEAEATE